MKGNEKLLTVLNQLLADELTAINQYMVHSEMCDNGATPSSTKPLKVKPRTRCTTPSG